MAKAEQGPLSPEKRELVELSKIECCALAHGFAKNPDAMSELFKLVDGKTLKAAADILMRTDHIAFPHNENIEIAYGRIAATELERLGENKPDFHCAHSPEEHTKALRSVISRLEKSVN